MRSSLHSLRILEDVATVSGCRVWIRSLLDLQVHALELARSQ